MGGWRVGGINQREHLRRSLIVACDVYNLSLYIPDIPGPRISEASPTPLTVLLACQCAHYSSVDEVGR